MLHMHMRQLYLHVEGRVQGVGFRWFVVHRARALGLDGLVRNRPDGTVEIEAEGKETALLELLEAVRRGPSAARVTRLRDAWNDGPARHRGFTIDD
jgi:acylphosphatase